MARVPVRRRGFVLMLLPQGACENLLCALKLLANVQAGRRQLGGHDLRRLAKAEQAQNHECTGNVHGGGQPGGGEDWRSGEAQGSGQSGQTQIFIQRDGVDSPIKRNAITAFLHRHHQLDGTHRSWTKRSMRCVQPCTSALSRRSAEAFTPIL